MASGTLAVVNVNAPAEDFQAIESTATAVLAKATDNKVNIHATGFTATATARRALKKEEGSAHCLPDKPGSLAADVMDRTMPLLHKFNFVLAVTTDRACTPGIAGRNGGRDMDVYIGKASQSESATRRTRRLDNDALVAAHELGHGVSEGHGGIVYVDNTDIGSSVDHPVAIGKPFDLRAYLTGGSGPVDYEEYGEMNNVMGAVTGPDEVQPNVIADAMLEWPKVISGQEPDPFVPAFPAPRTFTTVGSLSPHQIVDIKLDPPITLVDSDIKKLTEGDAGTHTFTDLFINPNINLKANYGVNFYLGDGGGHNIAELGGIGALPDVSQSSVVSYAKQRIRITCTPAETTIQQLPGRP
jgi:hypothetical protein